jgi:hypothetical protein
MGRPRSGRHFVFESWAGAKCVTVVARFDNPLANDLADMVRLHHHRA